MFRVFLFASLSAGVAVAQANHCEVKRNNGPCFYVSGTPDPITWRLYNNPGYAPPGYWSGAGVIAGAVTWRWIPSPVNLRWEEREVTGYYVWLRPTASTQAFPSTGYIPDFFMHAVRQRADGGFEPDPARPPMLALPGVSAPFLNEGAYRARSVLGAPVTAVHPPAYPHASEVCYSYAWQGGEHRFQQGAQGLVGTTTENPWFVPTWGWLEPSGQPHVVDQLVEVGQYSTLWGSYYEDEPSLNAESDYAHMRLNPPQPPLFTGCNDGAGRSDLSVRGVAIGWNVSAGLSHAGDTVVPLFNYSPSIPTSSVSFLGTELEVDVNNPLLGQMAVIGYWGTLDAAGDYDGARYPFSAVTDPAFLHWYLGMEFVVLTQTGIGPSTQSHWVKIE